MIAATNQIGFVIQRFDGPVVGWTAITESYSLREWAAVAMTMLERTPGAEYRIYSALGEKA